MLQDVPNKQFQRTHLIVILITIAWYVANILLNKLLTQYLAPRAYGDVAVILQILTLAVPFILIGTDYSIPRFIPKYLHNNNVHLLKGFRIWNRRLLKISFITCYVVGFIAVIIALVLDHYNIHSIDHYHPAIFSFWLIPLFAYWALESSLFDAFRRYIMSTTTNLIFTVLFIIILAITTMVLKQLSIYHIMFIIGLACVALIIILTLIIKLSLPTCYKDIEPSFTDKSSWRRTSLKMMISSVILSGLASVDIIMLEVLGKQENEVGYLAIIFTIFSIFTLINMTSSQLIMPNISIHSESTTARFNYLRQLMQIIQGVKMLISIIILIIICFVGRVILHFFGIIYQRAYDPLLMLSIGYIITLVLGSGQLLLFYSGQEDITVKVNLIQIAIVLIIDSALIPFYGIYGAILGLLLGQWFCSITCLIIVKKRYNYLSLWWRFKPPVV